MSIVKVIELIGESPEGFEAATRSVLEHAGKTIRNIKSIYVEDFQGKVKDNKIILYRVTAKVSFVVDAEVDD